MEFNGKTMTVYGEFSIGGGLDGAEVLDAHMKDKNNPHGVTAAQIGAVTQAELTAHADNKNNPHGVTAAQIGAITQAELQAALDSLVIPEGSGGGGGVSILYCTYEYKLSSPSGFIIADKGQEYFARSTPNIGDIFVTIAGYVGRITNIEDTYISGETDPIKQFAYTFIADLNGKQGEKGDAGGSIIYCSYALPLSSPSGVMVEQTGRNYFLNSTPKIGDVFVTLGGYAGQITDIKETYTSGETDPVKQFFYTFIADLNGKQGEKGKSAYEVALDNGFEGTEAEWLKSLKGADGTMSFDDLTEEQKAELKGEKGDDGEQGKQGEKGDDGEQGEKGKSAYEVALDNGFVGTEAAWLKSLKGADGTMTFDDLTEEQRESLKGDDGEQGADGNSVQYCTYNQALESPSSFIIADNDKTYFPKSTPKKGDIFITASGYVGYIDSYTKTQADGVGAYIEQTQYTFIANLNGTDGSGGNSAELASHINDKENPHEVTAAQIGAATQEWVQNALDSLVIEGGGGNSIQYCTYNKALDNPSSFIIADNNKTYFPKSTPKKGDLFITASGYVGYIDSYTKTQADGVGAYIEQTQYTFIADLNGADGDSLTDAEKAQIVSDVLAALPIYNGEVV